MLVIPALKKLRQEDYIVRLVSMTPSPKKSL
jgi:hypothetical protein